MKNKKIIAGAMAFVMAVIGTTTSITASAADTITVSGQKVTAEPGGSFTLNVSLAGVPATGVNAIEFALGYDSDIVSVTSVTAGKVANTGVDSQESAISSEVPAFAANYATAGEIDVTWSAASSTDSKYWVNTDGVFLTITGKVSSSAKAGDSTDFSLKGISRAASGDIAASDEVIFAAVSGTTATTYKSQADNGSVTVSAEDTTAATETTKASEDTTSGSNYAIGDVNLDGSINVADAVILAKSLNGISTLEDNQIAVADCYDDNTKAVNVHDVIAIVGYSIGRYSSLPVLA